MKSDLTFRLENLTLAELIESENCIRCIRPKGFAEVFISLKAPKGLLIHRLKVKYRFFDHPDINNRNRIRENKIFVTKNICHGVYLIRNSPICFEAEPTRK